MKKSYYAIAACIVLTATAFTTSILWTVSSEGVSINFELPDEGTKGTLSGLKAMIDFNPQDVTSSKIEATVDVSTLNTGNAKKDDHLKSADFFDVAKHPVIKFSSISVVVSSTGFIATGKLTIKDSTKMVKLPFTFTEDANGGTFKGELTVHSGDFGVTKKKKDGKDGVLVNITVPVKK